MNAFITSQFGYCPLIWRFQNRKMVKQMNRIRERALRTVYGVNNSSFEDLLTKSGSVSMHKMYKALNDLSSTLMSELFRVKGNIIFGMIMHLYLIFPISPTMV